MTTIINLRAVVRKLIQLTKEDKIWWEKTHDIFSSLISNISELDKREYTAQINNIRIRVTATALDSVPDHVDYSIDFSKAGKKTTAPYRNLPELRELVHCIENLCCSETDTQLLLADFLDSELPQTPEDL